MPTHRKIQPDDLIAPGATEGGTFRTPAPTRFPPRSIFGRLWFAVSVVCFVGTCVLVGFEVMHLGPVVS